MSTEAEALAAALYDIQPPSAADYMSQPPSVVFSSEWQMGWDACRCYVRQRIDAALASKPDAAPAGAPYTTEQAAELAGRFKLPLRMEYNEVFREDCEAVARLINHVRENSGDVMLWAHIARLEAAMKGPDGFATWQDAATDERIRRVAAERKLASSAAPAGLASLRGMAAGSLPAGMTSEDVVENSRAGWLGEQSPQGHEDRRCVQGARTEPGGSS